MEKILAQITDKGKKLDALKGYTINFTEAVPIYTDSWKNQTGTLDPLLFVPGKIVKIGKGTGGYYATWNSGGKVVGVTFASLDNIADVKSADVISLLFNKIKVFNDIYKYIYESKKPADEIVDKAVAAAKALGKGALKTAGTVLDLTKFVGDALPFLIIGGVIIFAVGQAGKAKRAVT